MTKVNSKLNKPMNILKKKTEGVSTFKKTEDLIKDG
jgi:hypothetical protein